MSVTQSEIHAIEALAKHLPQANTLHPATHT